MRTCVCTPEETDVFSSAHHLRLEPTRVRCLLPPYCTARPSLPVMVLSNLFSRFNNVFVFSVLLLLLLLLLMFGC